MNNKILINGEIETVTGLHIGTGGEFAAIGAIDSPVVKDPITRDPIIPGSSLKGKIRALLVQSLCPGAKEPKDDIDLIKRMFGAANDKGKSAKAFTSRFIFSDCFMTNKAELASIEVNTTEVKFENTINRLTGVANPRQIERVIRGTKFNFSVTYTVENEREAEEDIRTFAEGLKLLEYDYLGGGGSRGNGRIKFNNLSAEMVIGENSELETMCNNIFQGM